MSWHRKESSIRVIILQLLEFHNKTYNEFKDSLGDLRKEM